MGATARPRCQRAVVVIPVLIGLLAFGLRIWQPGPATITTDEPFWLVRADGFRAALVHGDFANATAAHQIAELHNTTMPGVTTMWAADAGRGLAHLGAALGLNDEVHGPSVQSPTVLRAGRGVVAAWSAILIGLVVAVGWALFGRVAGTVAGVLLATAPWFVGLGNVIHTDELLSLFGAVSLLGLVWALRHGRNSAEATRTTASSTPSAWLLAVFGAFAGLAVLTKLSALALVVPGAVIIVMIESFTEGDLRSGWWKPPVASRLFRRWGRLALWWSVGALVAFVALWPALWVAPLAQWRTLVHSAGLAGDGHPQFFLGSTTRAPGIIFYPVVWAFRMTPWMLIGALGVLVACVAQFVRWCRRTRRLARHDGTRPGPTGSIPPWLVLVGIPYAVVISLAPTKLDRYVVPLLPFLALAIGIVVADVARLVARRMHDEGSTRRLGFAAGVGATVAVSVVTLVQAPYAISHVNPMLGGQQVAQHAMLLGWGEGQAAMGTAVARREAGNCDQVRVAMIGIDSTIAVPCGEPVRMLVWLRQPEVGDYVVTNVGQFQRLDLARGLRAQGLQLELVDELEIGGVPYSRLWQVV